MARGTTIRSFLAIMAVKAYSHLGQLFTGRLPHSLGHKIAMTAFTTRPPIQVGLVAKLQSGDRHHTMSNRGRTGLSIKAFVAINTASTALPWTYFGLKLNAINGVASPTCHFPGHVIIE